MKLQKDNKEHKLQGGLGINQKQILQILNKVASGRQPQDISYYGGSISFGQRCISIGRECTLYYDVPWWIIDVRHAGAIFRQEQGGRLGHNSLRTFNGVLRSLIKKGMVVPVSAKVISQGLYNDPDKVKHCAMTNAPHRGNIRFVVMNIPDALCIK